MSEPTVFDPSFIADDFLEPVVEPILPPSSPLPRSSLRLRPRSRPSRPFALPKSPAIFPWLARRFFPGEATLWFGPPTFLEPVLAQLYAGVVFAGGRVSLVEGANRFHPYRLGEWGRAFGLDPAGFLEEIRLARAFTAYQLVGLVDAWSREAQAKRPTILVGHELPELFFTEEVPREERTPLLTYVAETLRSLTERFDVPLLLTVDGGFSRFPGLKEMGPRFFDLVTLEDRNETLVLQAYRDGSQLTLVPRPPGQHGMEEYLHPSHEEVVSWGAPPPRTARRSKSG